MYSVIPQKKNKWLNQRIHKKSNEIQYASKHYIYANQQVYEDNHYIFKKKYPLKQRKQRKKHKTQRKRKKVLKSMAFDYDDFVSQNVNESQSKRIQIRPTIDYHTNTKIADGIEETYDAYYHFHEYHLRYEYYEMLRNHSLGLKINMYIDINFDNTKKPLTHYRLYKLYEDTLKTIDLLDENDKLSRLICGYSSYELPPSVEETIRKYAWYNEGGYNLDCIAATNYIGQQIYEYINAEENKCPYSHNADFNILEYIYVRGGALRDCYLLRDINDIDFVIDVHGLSKLFLDHLMKYHSTIEQQTKCKCIYWRRYLRKFHTRYSRQSILQYASNISTDWDNPNDVEKILGLKDYMTRSNHLLNARFIVDILRNLGPIRQVRSVHDGKHWQLSLHPNQFKKHEVNWWSAPVRFDIVDGLDNSDGINVTFQQLGIINDLKQHEIECIIHDIEKCDAALSKIEPRRRNRRNGRNCKCERKLKEISAPIYPFSMNLSWYDLSINCAHIDLQSVLDHPHYDNNCGQHIDYHWENKLKRKFKNDKINGFNRIALHDMDKKIINGPDLRIINIGTADFYFWRFVKLVQKFIHKIYAGKWQINQEYLEHVQSLYASWFNEERILGQSLQNREKWVHKFLKWGIQSTQDMVDRFKVFRYIGFEEHFKRLLSVKHSALKREIESRLGINAHCSLQRISRQTQILRICFYDFGYTMLNIDDHSENSRILHDASRLDYHALDTCIAAEKDNHSSPMFQISTIDWDNYLSSWQQATMNAHQYSSFF